MELCGNNGCGSFGVIVGVWYSGGVGVGCGSEDISWKYQRTLSSLLIWMISFYPMEDTQKVLFWYLFYCVKIDGLFIGIHVDIIISCEVIYDLGVNGQPLRETTQERQEQELKLTLTLPSKVRQG